MKELNELSLHQNIVYMLNMRFDLSDGSGGIIGRVAVSEMVNVEEMHIVHSGVGNWTSHLWSFHLSPFT